MCADELEQAARASAAMVLTINNPIQSQVGGGGGGGGILLIYYNIMDIMSSGKEYR